MPKTFVRTRHQECRNGIIINETTCPTCKGTGSDKITLGVGEGKGEKCPTCDGKGKLVDKTPCEECVGGFLYSCDFCGNDIEGEDSNICATCEENPIAIQLTQPLDNKYLDGKQALAVRIEKVSPRGVNVRIGGGYTGYFKPVQNVRYRIGDLVAIRLREPLKKEDRGNAVQVLPLRSSNYKVVQKHLPVYDLSIKELTEKEGNIGKFVGQIIDVYYMRNGPTLFTFVDELGFTIQGGAIHPEGETAYPNLTKNTIVSVLARYKQIGGKDRLQIYKIEKAKGATVGEFFDKLANAIYGSEQTYDDLSFFVESSVYDQLRGQFISAAKRIRTAVMKNHNILIRYHSPCVDGATGAFAIDHAILNFVQTRGGNKGDFRRSVRRLPQRNSILEVYEVARDLSFALDQNPNNLPLYILVDVGSGEESKAALNICKSYGVDVIIIDHHSLHDNIKELSHSVLNPYAVGSDDNVTSGMLGTELAKFISPETDMSKSITQLAAISGYSDNVAGQEYDKYVEIAKDNEYDLNWLNNICSAVDYVLFGLRHFDGSEVIRNLLGITGTTEKNANLIESITPTSKSLFAKAINVTNANCTEEKLSDNVTLVSLDLDKFTPRFDYPSHSSILKSLHQSKIEDANGTTIVTLGIGDNYVVLLSSSGDFEFTKFLSEIQEEHINLGINGSGHASTGSIRFLSGHKEVVLEEIKKLIVK